MIRDLEVLDLLNGEPELLAMADAVAVTQRPRLRLPRPLILAPVLAAALVVVVLVAPWRGSSPSFFDQALAAVGNQPVLHVVTEQTFPADWELVDLATDERTTPDMMRRTEIWYDPGRELEHFVTHVNGQLSDETLQTPQGVRSREGVVYTCAWILAHPVEATRMRISCRFDGENGTEPRQVPEPPPVVDPGLSGFLTGYQQALEDGTARQVGEGTVDGRPVVWLEMHLPVPRPPGADRTPDPIEQRVAVDRETHRPVLVRSLDGQASYRVLRIETVATEDANFAEPEQAPAESLPTGGSVVSETEIGLDDAQTVLGTQAFWAGERVHGLPLTKVTHDVLSTHYARGSGVDPSRTEGLTLEYGSGERSVTINEATEPAVAYRWPSWDTLWPVPPAGTARVGPFGWAFLVRDGVYVSIMSPLGEEAALDAARALEPIPG